MVREIQHLINGKKHLNQPPDWHNIANPSNGDPVSKVAYATEKEVDDAVKAAEEAFPGWSATSAHKRCQILFTFKQLLQQHSDQIAHLISEEHGKTLPDAHGSIQRGIAVLDYACGIPNHLKGDYASNVGTLVDAYSIRQPLGICVGITPFNFPAMIPLWMYPIAVACGNTFILKPSEQDPSAPTFMAELLYQAGLPKGVLNVVHGDRHAVQKLISHPKTNAISFVGSTPVAQYVYQSATQLHKRVQAFGGAKNHCVVLPDADLDAAADALVGAGYGSAGERCMAISVIVAVGDKVANDLSKKIKALAEKLVIGPATQKDAMMGPLISQQHLKKVKSYVDLGVKEGAHLVLDGRPFSLKEHPNGNFMGPCLFDQVKASMKIYQEEIFGPVLSIVRVKSFEEALALVNENTYGNGTGIFTNNPMLARHFAEHVQVGMVGINIPIPVPAAQLSFGGWKNSVFADIHLHGPEGIQFYTKLKTVTSTWPKTQTVAGPDLAMPSGH